MNKVTLIGRLSKDPEMRYTESGKAICSFSLAVNRKWGRDNDGPTADFIPCVAWEKLAEIIGHNLAKGSQVAIEGRIQIRSYDAKDGSKRYATEVVVQEVEFIGPKPANAPSAPGAIPGKAVSDDDMQIPF